MAGTTVRRKLTSPVHSDKRDLLIEYNKLVTDVETLRNALDAVCDLLDADGGVSGTNYASTAAVTTAAAMTAAKIGNYAGTAYTA